MSDYLENKFVDHLLRGRAFTMPTTVYLALFTAAPSDAGGGTEVTGGAYARIQVGPSDSAWQSTQGTTTAVASSGSGGQTANGAIITLPVPTASWGVVTHFALMDALTAGNFLIWGALTQAKTVNNGDPAPTFSAAALTITFA